MTPIDLYTYDTPNGHKAAIMLEETGLPYRVRIIDIEAGEQRTPEFLALNPNNKIPVIVDPDRGITVFETGAILFYLAARSGRLEPKTPDEHIRTLQWVLFQAAHIGPTLGQIWNWKIFASEKLPAVIARFEREADRVFKVLDGQLGRHSFIAGPEFGIADVMTWPWINVAEPALKLDLRPYPNLACWFDQVGRRPAVQRALQAALPATQRARA